MKRPNPPRRPIRAVRSASTVSGPSGAKASASKSKTAPKPKKPPQRRARPARKRTATPRARSLFGRLFGRLFRLVWGIGWRVGLLAALVLGGWVGITAAGLPKFEDMLDGRVRGSVTILDRSGEVFAWRGDQYGGGLDAAAVSPHLRNAVVATEDKRFYLHPGIDPIGIVGAMRINMREGRSPLSGHGGSSITQQTAKLLCVGRAFDPTSGQTEAQYEAECRKSNLERKAREAIYALAMELAFTKEQVLTIYMNRAYLGAGTRGFEAASQLYFGKSSAKVTPAEAAMLAGLLKAPSRFAPTTNLERSQTRARLIIGLMEDQGYLSAVQAEEARNRPATLSAAAASRTGGYFADWVMGETPSWWGRETRDDVVLETTLDIEMQIAAEEALAHVFETKVKAGSKAEAAIVVMSPDGAVRAMVGGRAKDVPGGFNRAVQAKRQTGSAFKPFVYATALDLGYNLTDLVNDAPLTINVPGSGPWSPKNYTRDFKGLVTLSDALKDSLNTPAVRISESVGRERVMDVATRFGIDSTLYDGPSLALGVSETTLLELTAAYAGIRNGGRAVFPYGLTALRMFGESQPQIEGRDSLGDQVISPQAAQQLTYMMYQVMEAGTGRRARLEGRPAAAKTGTSQAQRDAWFVGFTGEYVAGVWMGYDDNTPLSGVTGGGLPADIWRETMLRIHEGLPVSDLQMITPDQLPNRLVERGGDPAEPVRPQGPETGESPVERALRNVFRDLFGTR